MDRLFRNHPTFSHSNNKIILNLPTDALCIVLRSASAERTGANEVVSKLTEKNKVPVPSFEIFSITDIGRCVKVAHDVRIDVIKPGDVALLT